MNWVADHSKVRSRMVKAAAAGCVAATLLSTNASDAFGAGGRDAKLAAVEGIATYNKGDYVLAFHLLQSAANQGDSDAEVNLGYMYARGRAVQADQAEALRLYRLSAENGNGEGMNAIDLPGSFCSKRFVGNGIGKELGHAEEETWRGADCDAAAADRGGAVTG
jgi:TPR repeat protein